jgi:hypothetical protein
VRVPPLSICTVTRYTPCPPRLLLRSMALPTSAPPTAPMMVAAVRPLPPPI